MDLVWFLLRVRVQPILGIYNRHTVFIQLNILVRRETMTFSQRWHAFFDKPIPNIILRLVVMSIGLAFVAMGVALSRATGLGTSPISCIPAVFSFITPVTIGTFTFILNVIFVFVQVILLRRDFHPLQLLQIVFVFAFSILIDFFVPIYAAVPFANYLAQVVGSVIACVFTATGVFLQVKAALIMLPGDGIVLTVARVFKKDLSKCKIAFDSSMVAIAAVSSLVSMGGLFGVREGTILMALCTGLFMRGLHRVFCNFEKFVPTKGHVTLTPQEQQ